MDTRARLFTLLFVLVLFVLPLVALLFTRVTLFEDMSWVFQLDTIRVTGCLPFGLCQ
jgi:hypothetical protein